MSATKETNLPSRTSTDLTDDEAVPDHDPTNTTGLLSERLRAWKHMCAYLEEYIKSVSHEQKANAKDQEKVLKSISKPLREGHHFDQAIGGVSGLFENIRSNTSAIANMHTETSKNLDGTVLPILERLHKEIKNKDKELQHGAGKAAKSVDKARNESQKYIELLGQHTATFDSSGGKVNAQNDPYVIQRGIFHRLNKQILEENNNRNDIISVQNNFRDFEAHILTQVQSALNTFQQFMASQADRQKAIYGDVSAVAANIPPDFEWNGFVKRNDNLLVDPNAPLRSMDNVGFPNQGHRATKPLIEGSLERKSRMALKGYSSGYYAVTPAGYLHEYKDNDDFRHDPAPENSWYLPDCTVGAVAENKFSIKGKDMSGGKIGQKLARESEYSFKAHTAHDAQEWHRIVAGSATPSQSLPSSAVTSPVSAGAGSTAASLPATEAERKETAHAAGEPVVGQQPGRIDTADFGAGQGTGTTNTAAPGAGTGVGAGLGDQEAGVTRSGTTASQATTAVPEKAQYPVGSPTTSTSTPGDTHFHGQPAANALEERKYVQR